MKDFFVHKLANHRERVAVLMTKAKLFVRVGEANRLRLARPLADQDGAIAVMTAGVLIVMLAFFGFALDLSRTFNRKVELQNVADAAALAAVRSLDGTPAGIDKAVSAAESVAVGFAYSYNNSAVSWSNAAIKFGTAADGSAGWMDASAASGSADKVFFVKVDTSGLDQTHGSVANAFMPVLSSSFSETRVAGIAVAGRESLNITPLAICANSPLPAESRSGELVEYGFRRGVAYDLMQLNPGGTTPENFLVNPIAPPGTVGSSVIGNFDLIAPFVCVGQVAFPTVSGGDITVERYFPIASLYGQLNSRFGTYVAPCQPASAPADANVTSFTYNGGSAWMKKQPDGQQANSLTSGGRLWTVADPNPSPGGTQDTAYGVLWSYAKAAKYSSYVASGGVEPALGYSTYAPSDWATLYNPGSPVANSYPGTTPYQATGGASAYKTSRNTRVLNIPLLQCPVPAGAKATAKVLAIGRFFMTVPADTSCVRGEFAGLVQETALGGSVELFK